MARKTYIRENIAWANMKGRCYNPNASHYSYYGARGITVCKRWRDSFDNFLGDMGTRPNGFSLDRINVDGGYSPSNCRWASLDTQANNKRDNVYLEYNNKKMTISHWSKEVGINRLTIGRRVRRGWTIGQSLGFEKRVRVNLQSRSYYTHMGTKKSIIDWIISLDISECTYKARKNRGWSTSESLGLESRVKFESMMTKYTHNGITKTSAQWASENNIKMCTYRGRKARGWSTGESLGFIQRKRR